jgi:hypothetical protein
MKEAAKAWLAAFTAPLSIVVFHLIQQTAWVQAMPDDVRAQIATMVTLLLGGLSGLIVYLVPNRPKE